MSAAQVMVHRIGMRARSRGFSASSVGCSLAQASVGSVLVVILDEVVEKPTELALIPDQGLVQQFVADGADPSLGECVGSRSAELDGDDRTADRGELIIK